MTTISHIAVCKKKVNICVNCYGYFLLFLLVRYKTYMTIEIITGSTDTHLVRLDSGKADTENKLIHKQVLKPLTKLQLAAKKAGFDLRICSGYRSFDRQLLIWNGKASGIRPVMDPFGKAIKYASLRSMAKNSSHSSLVCTSRCVETSLGN